MGNLDNVALIILIDVGYEIYIFDKILKLSFSFIHKKNSFLTVDIS